MVYFYFFLSLYVLTSFLLFYLFSYKVYMLKDITALDARFKMFIQKT